MVIANEFQPLRSGEYTIILYHGVYDDSLDLEGRNSSGKHISESTFLSQMNTVIRNWNVVTMSEIALAHQGLFELPEKSVAVTIDDGFSNTYYHAWPILKELGIRATYYLATGLIGTGNMGWTDKLESLFLDSSESQIAINIDGQIHRYELAGQEKRVSALTDLKFFCKQLPFDQVSQVLEDVACQLHMEPDSSHPLYEMLTWDQVREMFHEGTFEFGSHTVDHIPLSRLPFNEMARQVEESLHRITIEIGEKCNKFSYPEGQADDFNEQCIDFLKSIGLDHCPTAIEGKNSIHLTDPFKIKRCMIGFEGRPFILN